MGILLSRFRHRELTEYQKLKLIHEFRIFWDCNKDGKVTWDDLNTIRQLIVDWRDWKPCQKSYLEFTNDIINIWINLRDALDTNYTNQISECEWLDAWSLFIGERKYMQRRLEQGKRVQYNFNELPKWFNELIRLRWIIYDIDRNGTISRDEFVKANVVLGVPHDQSDKAFTLLSTDGEELSRSDFVSHWRNFAVSEDPNDPCNAVGGRDHYEEDMLPNIKDPDEPLTRKQLKKLMKEGQNLLAKN